MVQDRANDTPTAPSAVSLARMHHRSGEPKTLSREQKLAFNALLKQTVHRIFVQITFNN